MYQLIIIVNLINKMYQQCFSFLRGEGGGRAIIYIFIKLPGWQNKIQNWNSTNKLITSIFNFLTRLIIWDFNNNEVITKKLRPLLNLNELYF